MIDAKTAPTIANLTIYKYVCYNLKMNSLRSSERNHRSQPDRHYDENPQVTALLGSAGLNAVDMQLFENLRNQGFTSFVHGSIMQNRIRPGSDVDFTIIGKSINEMDPELRDTLIPGVLAAKSLGRRIDYISTSVLGQSGRKLSLHISEDSFRESYPVLDKPFASEFRSGQHAKSGPRAYFLPAADQSGNTRLINFVSESTSIGGDGSTITDIPQTGILEVAGDSLVTDGQIKQSVRVDKIFRLNAEGQLEDYPADSPEKLVILGLEHDKMVSDTPLFNDDKAFERLVRQPAQRSEEAIGQFAAINPAVLVKQLYRDLAQYWPKVKPNKPR